MGSLPQPPDLHMDATAQAVFIAVQAVPAALVLLWAARALLRDGDSLPLLCMLGGAAAMFLEPIIDLLGLVWYPRDGQWVMYELFGRPIPWFVVAYIWFVGAQTIYTIRRMRERPSMVLLLQLYLVYLLMDYVMELPGLYLETYVYYGEQPFVLFKLPLWAPFLNACLPIFAATMVIVFSRWLGGWRRLGVVALVPAAVATVDGAVGWPLWLMLNGDVPAVVVWLAAVVLMAQAVFAVYLCGSLIEYLAARDDRASARTGIGEEPSTGTALRPREAAAESAPA